MTSKKMKCRREIVEEPKNAFERQRMAEEEEKIA